jgi:acylphosphatase
MSDGSDIRCMRCLISGRVQGVGFRAHARHEAQALSLSGHARNLPDGRVEVLACGEARALESFRAWLGRGPRLAWVGRVECSDHPDPPPDGFHIE